MKNLKAFVGVILLIIINTNIFAQEQRVLAPEPDRNKPKLFADLPEKINVNKTDLETVFNSPAGSSSRVVGNTLFNGTVVSKSNINDGSAKTIIINLAQRQGAHLILTQRMKDGKVSYFGRIISKNNSDAYEIREENGQYILEKKNYYDIVSE